MATSQDPLFAALHEAVEMVIVRGIEVRPMADGFYIRVASQELADEQERKAAQSGRSW